MGLDLEEGASLAMVANSVNDIAKGKLVVDGEIIAVGRYTSENCDWIEGSGRVQVGSAGTMIMFR